MTSYDYDAMVFLNRVDDQLALAYFRAKEAMERTEVDAVALRRDQAVAAEATLDAGLGVFEPGVYGILDELDRSISRPGGLRGYGVRVATEHALRRFKGKMRVAGAAHVARFGISPQLDEIRVEFDRQLEDILDRALGLSAALGRPEPEGAAMVGEEIVFDALDGSPDDAGWTLYDLEAIARVDAAPPAEDGELRSAEDSRSRQTSFADVLKQMWPLRARSAL